MALKLDTYSAKEQKSIREALVFAENAHQGQHRLSGEDFVSHPIAVASYLIDLKFDAEAIVAALLHDTVEDTGVSLDLIEQKFGRKVKELVDGVTLMASLEAPKSQPNAIRYRTSIENLRKLLLATSYDWRVLAIKLADRRHNLMTLEFLGPESRKRVADESLAVFAPLADRLGMGALKAEIEDLAFQYAMPDQFELTRKIMAGQDTELRTYVEKIRPLVEKLLLASSIPFISLNARRKHLYSIWRKLQKEGDISKIYDLVALRIIVPEIQDCYQVLGLLHQNYKPLIYRIKDYIAVPKPNGYRSLHTTVFGLDGKITEFQIRTPVMHEEAEKGMAAHAVYDLHKNTKGYRSGGVAPKIEWAGQLGGVTRETSGVELVDYLQTDFFKKRIFVFSPLGDLFDLPEGATAVDFAFAIHTDIGLRTAGAKVNGKIAPLDRPLQNRDVVEVITRKQAAPNRQWLNFVKTAGAKSKIKSWFKAASRQSNISTGRNLLESQLGPWGWNKIEDIPQSAMEKGLKAFNLQDKDSLLAAIGEGAVPVSTAIRRLLPALPATEAPTETVTSKHPSGKMFVVAGPELKCSPAGCCQPETGDSIIGYITRGSGVTVHRLGCQNIPAEPERLIECAWDLAMKVQVSAAISLLAKDSEALRQIANLEKEYNIVKLTSKIVTGSEELVEIKIVVRARDMFSINGLIQKLAANKSVVKVGLVEQTRTELV
jgi:guanosine-3',5'-bis(diphosphate) 3'-pyrophosphohydrolase